MGTLARKKTLFPDLFDLLEMPFTAMQPFAGQTIRVEDYMEDGKYVVRAELPGVDPDKDLEISVARGILTIHAEREEEQTEKYRSEFRYGSYDRHIRLPEGVQAEDVTASYDKGILTVTMPLQEVKEGAHRIPVQH
jgi:HSP20 family molecular chaperone IbpA